MKLFHKAILLGALAIAYSATVNAGVIIGGTRVIYDGSKKEVSLSVNNPDTVPYLIQSWIDTQAGGVEKAPFIITPPLYRLDQGQQNLMRIVLAGNKLPEDKESLFWLNIKSIPSAPKKENTLQVAVKTRIKLIYRPAALKKIVPEDLAGQLTWHTVGSQVEVSNPTRVYMNFNQISLNGRALPDVSFVAPGGTARFNLPSGISSGTLTFKIISDYGGIGEIHTTTL
ncbi:FimC family chaperone protein [Buttiauxella brennerae ATCC 51605]|jgi:P pilus assembly chaperone PapD|uniref:FimC family chaperone protein n=1 Tax=Buttiauxella brennerae ATCC 51605 TaxID=1354251 RepID=A0A1B7IQ24_9ENTR|nr:molecular chaperone [Buttiauxella brennerae]OAT31841.1 FimC family chaperone protein [Buttiauxella brennerae ATCC 51605]